MNRSILQLVGADIETSSTPDYEFAGIKLNLSPQIILKPNLGVTLAEIKNNIGKTHLKISRPSTVVLDKETFKDQPAELVIDGQFNVPQKY